MQKDSQNMSSGAGIPQAHMSLDDLTATDSGTESTGKDSNASDDREDSGALPQAAGKSKSKSNKRMMDPMLVRATLKLLSTQGLDPLSEQFKLQQLKSDSGYSMQILREMLGQLKAKNALQSAESPLDVEQLFTMQHRAAPSIYRSSRISSPSSLTFWIWLITSRL